MKKIALSICILVIISYGCEKENDISQKIIGKWQLVKEYSLMNGGDYLAELESQMIEEYKNDKQRIIYDYIGNEIARCSYKISSSSITIYGENLNGEEWKSEIDYWFQQDTLVQRHDGGFEYYDGFYIRIE